MNDLVPRAVLAKRQLSKGGIAGIAVGVVAVVALFLLCLYPVVIRRVIQRQRQRRQQRRQEKEKHDVEAGEAPASGGSAGTDNERRLSSQDSFKPAEDLSRGVMDGGSVKDMGWTPPADGIPRSDSHGLDQVPRSVPTNGDGQPVPFGPPTRTESQLTSFTGYEEEFVPQSTDEGHDGTLTFTSADYYNPNVPSSAFGMLQTEEPQPIPEPERQMSRGSSLRYNIKQMFRRKSTRDQSMNSPTSPTFGSTFDTTRSLSAQDTPLERITTAEVTSESPTDIYPPANDLMPPSEPRALGSPINLPAISSETTPQPTVQTPPLSSPDSKFRGSASPPTNPAPGTINPMDIMPASTQSEMWHRTEYQLYNMSNNPSSSPPSTVPPSEQASPEVPTDSPSPLTLPPNFPNVTPVIQTPTPTQEYAPFKREPVEEHDIAMVDIPSHIHLTPAPERDVRHPSYPSEVSTPLPGPASTNPSTLNTPATQLDTPSPNSEVTSSDYHHSVSPGNGMIHQSPKHGAYPCDEPGCGQVFDQPHKLKHHQRYHTKEHKCTYPNCGKGFGTKTHLQRHINDRHEKKKKFHCAVPGCDYSRQGGKGFPRKDNWKRHMTKIHNMDQRNLPEPIEADSDMTGV